MGRKRNRGQKDFLIRYLERELPSLRIIARNRNKSERVLAAKMKRSLDCFLANTPWPTLPESNSLVVVADAMVKYVEKKWRAFYFVAVKKSADNYAVLARPFVRQGTETSIGWSMALGQLPDAVKANIKAIVSDGHRGLVGYAKQNGIILQRCHFHLIARIQGRCSKWKSGRNQGEGLRIYGLVKTALETKNREELLRAVAELEGASWEIKSGMLKTILSGFVKSYGDFRSYLEYPELNLPRTSNAIESFIGSIQELCHRARGFRTLKALQNWIAAIVKHKKKIKCNGYFQQS